MTVVDLHAALMIAVGKAALAKHQETCEACSDTHDCVVAKVHLDTIERLREQPGAPS